jgi:hypothetical protein
MVLLTRETVEVGCPKKLEESDSMFRELRKVLIYHVQRRLEDSIKDRRNLRCQ